MDSQNTATMPAGQLPKARQILSESWAIYKTRFKTLILISLIPTAAMLVLGAMFVGGGIAGAKVFHIDSNALGIAGVVLAIVAVIAFIYLCVWSAVAEIQAIKDADDTIKFKEAYAKSRSKINPFFSTNLLVGLAAFGGFLLLIIPGIIFSLWFSQSSYIVMEENLANTEALKRSKYYVKGRLGEVFGKLFYIGIITLIIYLIVNLAFGGFAAEPQEVYSLASIMNNVFSLIWTPLTVVYAFQLYKHLRATRP